MIPIFESILPIFLLIIAGVVLRRVQLFKPETWPALEQLTYWFLYPSLLFITILNADFSGLQLDAMMIALLGSLFLMALLALAAWPPLVRARAATKPEYSSVFQTALRWNGFIAFAIAEKLFAPAGVAVVALVMAVIIIPINIMSVYIVSRFAERDADWGSIGRAMATNPLILASLGAVLMRAQPFGFYEPFNEALDLVGRAALGLGLLAIGAGLKPGDLWTPRMALWIPVVLKLAVFPAILIGACLMLGVRGPELQYLALCAAVPTAMNGYLLAKQLGGDAELYAAVVTLQTAISFVTIPVVLAVSAQLISG